jgi:hypothetical protein
MLYQYVVFGKSLQSIHVEDRMNLMSRPLSGFHLLFE